MSRRWAFTSVAARSLLLWLVWAAVYARSCVVGDVFRWGGPVEGRPGTGRRHTLTLTAGTVEFYTFTLTRRPGARPRRNGMDVSQPVPLRWEFTRPLDPYVGRPVRSVWNRLGFIDHTWRYPASSERLVVAPLWPLLVLFAAPPLWWDVRRRQRAAAAAARDDGEAVAAGHDRPPVPPTAETG